MKGLLASLALLAIAHPAGAYEWIRTSGTPGKVVSYAKFESRFDGTARINTLFQAGDKIKTYMRYTISCRDEAMMNDNGVEFIKKNGIWRFINSMNAGKPAADLQEYYVIGCRTKVR